MQPCKPRELLKPIFYLCQTRDVIFSPTNPCWKRKFLHLLCSETEGLKYSHDSPSLNAFLPLSSHTDKSITHRSFYSASPSFFPRFHFYNIKPQEKEGAEERPSENPSHFSSSCPHRGFPPLTYLCQTTAGLFSP